MWQVGSSQPPEPGVENGTGMFLNWMKVGYLEGGGVTFDRDEWNAFNDWWRDDFSGPRDDEERIQVTSDIDPGSESLTLWARNAGDPVWTPYPCTRENPGTDWWIGPAPLVEIGDAGMDGGEIHYYYAVYDAGELAATYPDGAPGTDEPGERRYLEFSLLPTTNPGTGEPPEVLLVDKHGRRTPGEGRDYAHYSEYYYREALEIMGYVDAEGNPLYDVYDVEVPTATNEKSDGPPSGLLDHYDTVFWCTSDVPTAGVKSVDAQNLMDWLNMGMPTAPRSLWLTGNNNNTELASGDATQQAFQVTYLTTGFVRGSVVAPDPPTHESHPNLWPGLVDNPGGEFVFMDSDDGACILAGDCPLMPEFDVVFPLIGEAVADYEILEGGEPTRYSAGVANAYEGWYSVVNLGFGLEFMMDSIVEEGGRTEYTYVSGVHDRVNLVENVVAEYFEEPPTGEPTGVVVDERRNELSQAYPNPFNPLTKITYSVKDAGRVTIRIYNVAGREVRTLLDTEMAAGTSGYAVWDGLDDAGKQCGTGVYLYSIEAPGFASSKKMIMMK
jgi:hypothetical protein